MQRRRRSPSTSSSTPVPALIAGAHGWAPAGRLARLGDDKFGLWFEGGDIHQGYTNDYAIALALSESAIVELGTFDTGQTNMGTCSNDPERQKESVHERPCWGYEGHAELVRLEGQSYYLLRVRYRGTQELEWGGKIVPNNRAVHYGITDDKYREVADRRHAEATALPDADVFNVAETEEGEQPIPTIPRKRLKFE
jgi:hypothetical protein